MNIPVRPELPTAALRSSQATHAAVDNSAPLPTRPESTYKSGKAVQTTGATSDIEAIASYIERDSAWYAKAVASKSVETAETIPDFPELGRVVPKVGDASVRERFVHSYRII